MFLDLGNYVEDVLIRYEFFFADLCTQLGYCLSPDQQIQIVQQQIDQIDDLIELILLAEGLQPEYISRPQKRELKRFIEPFWTSAIELD